MKHPEFTRSFDIEPGDGRTLLGVAFKFDTPSKVRDPGRAPYLEEFARSSVDKTLRQRPTVPLLLLHDASRLPVGVATFERGEHAVAFEAKISETPGGDEALTLVNDGALRSVSVRFRDFSPPRFRSSPEGRVTTRTEIGLRELSLLPTGFGAHEGAEVLAVRSEGIETPRLDALRRRKALLLVIDV